MIEKPFPYKEGNQIAEGMWEERRKRQCVEKEGPGEKQGG